MKLRAAALIGVCLVVTIFAFPRSQPQEDLPDLEVLQKLREHQDAQNPAFHFQRKVQEFHQENSALDPSAGTIVFAGDSLTESFDLDHFFPGVPVLNRGISADGIWAPQNMPDYTGLLNRVRPTFVDTKPRVVFLLIGTNHLHETDVPVERIFAGYKRVHDEALSANPDAEFVVQTVPPFGRARADWEYANRRAREYNQLLREFAEDKGHEIVDLYWLFADYDGALRDMYTVDGIHLTPRAYERWADVAGDKINQLAPDLGPRTEMNVAAANK